MPGADEGLLEAWRGGDTTAGTALFRTYFPSVRRFFVNKVPERDVDDLLQRTFTAMVESRDRFRGDGPFRGFVFAIARRVLLRHLRDYARRDSKLDIDFSVSSLAEMNITPRTVIALQQDQETIRRALQRIPVQAQTMLELSYWEELSHAELAVILGIEPTTVRTRLFRARKLLLGELVASGLIDELAVDRAAELLGKRI